MDPLDYVGTKVYQGPELTAEWNIETRQHTDYQTGVSTPFTDAENAAAETILAERGRQTNRTTLETRARNAVQGNRDFLNLASPTNAQTLAQVKALTRQMNAIIKITVNDLDTTN